MTTGTLPERLRQEARYSGYPRADLYTEAALRVEALESALAELVACKDLQETRERGGRDMSTKQYAELSAEWLRRQPLAWQAARRLVEGK